jgi:adenylate kinase
LAGIIGITGTPGTGKKSIAPILAKNFGLPCISLNELAKSRGLVVSAAEGAVDTEKLRKAVLSSLPGEVVVYGHLLPYVLSPSIVSKVAVLRCEPSELKSRLKDRRYEGPKLTENLEAELIGLISSDTYDAFGSEKSFDFDTSGLSPAQSARLISDVVRGPSASSRRIDWTQGYDSGAKLRLLLSATTE